MTKTAPLFSIIIPLFNKEQYLEDCLVSIQNQTEKNWECIIVNDGSTDGSEAIARQFEKDDARFKVFNQKNAGPSVARNLGITEAEGELLHFMDADDYYPSDDSLSSIATLYNKEHPMAISGTILIYDSVSGITRDSVPVNSKEIKYQTFDELQNDYFFTRFFFNRKFIQKYKVTFPEYTYVGEDPVFLVKALSNTDKFLITDIPVYTYRQVAGSGSVIAKYTETKLIGYMTAQLEILEICEENNYSVLKQRILERIDHETLDLYMEYKDKNIVVSNGLKKILSFMDSEAHYERVLNSRRKEVYIRELEATITQLKAEAESLKQPSIKTATRSVLGAVKRRVKRTYKKV